MLLIWAAEVFFGFGTDKAFLIDLIIQDNRATRANRHQIGHIGTPFLADNHY